MATTECLRTGPAPLPQTTSCCLAPTGAGPRTTRCTRAPPGTKLTSINLCCSSGDTLLPSKPTQEEIRSQVMTLQSDTEIRLHSLNRHTGCKDALQDCEADSNSLCVSHPVERLHKNAASKSMNDPPHNPKVSVGSVYEYGRDQTLTKQSGKNHETSRVTRYQAEQVFLCLLLQ